MNFSMTGEFKKVLWQGQDGKVLALFAEQYKDQTRDWAIFCNEQPGMGVFKVQGYVSKSKSKKYFNDKGQAGNDFSFNAVMIEAVNSDSPAVSYGDDEIPF